MLAFVGYVFSDQYSTCKAGTFSDRLSRRSDLTSRKDPKMWSQDWASSCDLRIVCCICLQHRELPCSANSGGMSLRNYPAGVTALWWKIHPCYSSAWLDFMKQEQHSFRPCAGLNQNQQPLEPITSYFVLENSSISQNSETIQVCSVAPKIWTLDMGFFTVAHV